MDENNILLKLDIETLKDLLDSSGMASDPGRENFCNNIGIKIGDLSPENLRGVNDNIFINKLLERLQATGNITALQKLCERIEPQFRDGLFENKVKKISRQLRTFELIPILTEDGLNTKLNKEYKWAYQQCFSHKKSQIGLKKPLNELLPEDVTNLDQYKSDLDHRFSLLDCFIGYLKLKIQENHSGFSQELERWQNKYQSHLEDLMKILNHQQQGFSQTKETCLVVAIFERNEGLKIQVWIINDISETNSSVLLSEEAEFSLQEFPEKFRDIYQKSLQHCDFFQKIKVFLPYKRVDSNIITMVDKLVVDEQVPDFARKTFGQDYEVTIEFSERLGTNNSYVSKWKKKRDYFEAQKLQYELVRDILSPFIQSDMSSLKNLSQELLPDHVLGRRFINKNDIESLMAILFYSGIPFALWVREDISEVNFEKELEEICQASCLHTLSSIIKKKRYEARVQDNHIGNYLSLLWDVNNLRPETHKLSMS